MLRTVFCLFLLSFSTVSPAQVTRFKRMTSAQGLPSDIVNSLLQDREGFLWVGTADGLCRYDGYTFKIYRYDPDDPNSLPTNVVETLYEDRSGTLWIGLAGGLARFDKKTEHFTSYTYRPNDSTSINGGAIADMYEDPKGRFWVVAWNGGLQEMDREHGTFHCLFPQPEAEFYNNMLFASPILPDSNCADCFFFALGVAGKWRLYSFNGSDKTFTPCQSDGLPPRSYIWDIIPDDNGTAWYVTSSGLRLFDTKAQKFVPCVGLPDSFMTMCSKALFSAYKDAREHFWVGTYGDGLYEFDQKKNLVGHYKHEPNIPSSLLGNAVRAILRDRSGIVWAGSLNLGLNRLTSEEQFFRHFNIEPKHTSARLVNTTTAFAESRSGPIWVGSEYSGVLLWDPQTHQIQPASKRYPELDSVANQYVFSLCEMRDGQLWIGMNGRGLCRFDPQKRTWHRFLHNEADSASLPSDYVTSLIEDRSGRLWAGTYQGLCRYDPKTGGFDNYFLTDPANPAGAILNQISCLYLDRSGAIWVGTPYGLSLFDPAVGTFRDILGIKTADGKPQNFTVRAVFQDLQGTHWACTEIGLYRLNFPDPTRPDKGKPIVRRYTEADGLPNQNVLDIAQDNRGRLWLQTLDGVSVFRNPRHDARTPPDFKNYDRDDGLLNRTFLESCCLKTRSGLLCLGGRDGFDVLNPDSIHDDGFRPYMVITSLRKFDTARPEAGAVAVPGVSMLKEVVLSHRNNIFSLEFAALDFREPDNIRYAYRLVGFNDTWVQIGTQRQVTFTNLDPGSYTFEVRGTNSDGIWNDVPASLKIIVRPPWWKSLWAYIVYALLFAAGIVGLVWARLRFLENRTRELEQAVTLGTAKISEQKDILAKQAMELQEIDRLKSRFYANVTHELRTPLTLMLGPLNSVLKNWKADPAHRDLLQIALTNGRKLLNLVSEILDLGKLDANRMTVNPGPVAIQPLLARLVALFDSHARYLGVNLACRCDLTPGWAVSMDAKKFETVVNNLLSNALKFTPPGGSVEVTLVQNKPGMLLLSVRDNGRGIHPDDTPHVFDRYFQTKRPDTPDEGGTGIGLALSAELVRLCSGRIWVDSRVGEGSTFWVEWPFDPDTEYSADTKGGNLYRPITPLQEADVKGVAENSNSVSPATVPFPTAKEEVKSGADAPLKILVAEDNLDLQAYLHHLLAPEYDITLVANGEEALAAIDP
ncbi:MAG: two-component regulator propeller domain-containing protein, partial [Saprospiraceae bacterium]